MLGRNTEQYFELDPSLNVNPETSDGRNMAFRDRTLWTFYVVTIVGLFGLAVRIRQPMVLLVFVIAAYFTLSSLVIVAPPRVRAPLRPLLLHRCRPGGRVGLVTGAGPPGAVGRPPSRRAV